MEMDNFLPPYMMHTTFTTLISMTWKRRRYYIYFIPPLRVLHSVLQSPRPDRVKRERELLDQQKLNSFNYLIICSEFMREEVNSMCLSRISITRLRLWRS